MSVKVVCRFRPEMRTRKMLVSRLTSQMAYVSLLDYP